MINKELFRRLGWIDPQGKFYGFDSTWQHDEFAFAKFPNVTNPVDYMERLGWIRISCPSDQMISFPAIYCKRAINQPQQSTLFDWAELAGEDYQELLNEFNLEVE